MKGYRTIIGNIVGGAALAVSSFGIDIPPDDQAALVGGIAAVVSIFNVIMRFVTTTPVGRKG